MRSGIAIAIAVVVVLCCISVGAVYAYNASFSDEFGRQDIGADYGRFEFGDSTVTYIDHDTDVRYALLEVEVSARQDTDSEWIKLTLDGKEYKSGVFYGKAHFSSILLSLENNEGVNRTEPMLYSAEDSDGNTLSEFKFIGYHLGEGSHILDVSGQKSIHSEDSLVTLELGSGIYSAAGVSIFAPNTTVLLPGSGSWQGMDYTFQNGTLMIDSAVITENGRCETSKGLLDTTLSNNTAIVILLTQISNEGSFTLDTNGSIAFYMPDKDVSVVEESQ